MIIPQRNYSPRRFRRAVRWHRFWMRLHLSLIHIYNPEDKVYAPLLDRFDLKIITEYIRDKEARQQILHDKIIGATAGRMPDKITLDELRQMQQEVSEVEVPESVSDMMDDVLCEMRREKPVSYTHLAFH